MRNLKRVLSLALALVMVLGMMVIGTSAASFADAEKVTYEEAVAVMAGIGLYKGDDKGNVNPDVVLTRKDAATLMARIMLGGKYKNLDDKTAGQIFTDVATGSWYAAEVEYCYNMGLIGGLGNGTFNPDGELTGIAFAKLLLVALGFDADAQGYGGKDWATNIAIDALSTGLYIDGVDIAAKLTREQAAQMILQVLETKMVQYINSFDKSTGAATVLGPLPARLTFAEKYFNGLEKLPAGNDDWGRPYAYKWEYDEVLYTAWEAPINTYVVAVSDCDIAKDMEVKEDDEVVAYFNGVEESIWLDVSSQRKTNGGQGVLIEVYEDEVVIIDTYLAMVTKVTEEKLDKNGHVLVSPKSDVVVWFSAQGTPDEIADETSYAKGSMILVNYNEEYDFYEIVGEAPALVSYQSAYTTKDSHILGEDKDEYPDAAQFNLDCAGDSTEEFFWLFDQYENLIGNIPVPEDPSSYATISSIYWKDSFDGEDGYAVAKLTFMDGTSETVKLTKIDDVALEGIEGNFADYEYGWVSSSKNYNKAEYTNKALYVVKGTTLTTVDYLPDATTETGVPALTDEIDAGNATMFLVWTGKAYETYTGIKNIPTYVSGDFWYVDEDENGVVEYVFIINPTGKAAGIYTTSFFFNGPLTVTTHLKNSTQEYYVIDGGYVDGVENVIKTKNADLRDAIMAESCKLMVLAVKSGYVVDFMTVTEKPVAVDTLGAYAVYAGESDVDLYHDVLVDEFGNSYDIENIEEIACDHEDKSADYLYVIYKYGRKGTKIASLVYATCTEGDEYVEEPTTPEVKGNLYSVKVLGVEIESEDGINYVAEVCSEELTTTGNRLEVVDNYAGAEMAIYFTSSNEAKFTGTGSVADNGTTVKNGSKWIVVSDGVEYTITVVVKDHDATIVGDNTSVKVDAGKILIAANVADEADSAEAVLAALEAHLTIAETATYVYDAEAQTFTVTPECGHEATEYAVEFVAVLP